MIPSLPIDATTLLPPAVSIHTLPRIGSTRTSLGGTGCCARPATDRMASAAVSATTFLISILSVLSAAIGRRAIAVGPVAVLQLRLVFRVHRVHASGRSIIRHAVARANVF